MTNLVMIMSTFITALFTFLIWKVYNQIAWFTGAMESQSNLMLQIEAKKGINGKPIKLVWWDPTIDDIPADKTHGQEISLDTIYVYLPLNQRKIKPSWCSKIKELLYLP